MKHNPEDVAPLVDTTAAAALNQMLSFSVPTKVNGELVPNSVTFFINGWINKETGEVRQEPFGRFQAKKFALYLYKLMNKPEIKSKSIAVLSASERYVISIDKVNNRVVLVKSIDEHKFQIAADHKINFQCTYGELSEFMKKDHKSDKEAPKSVLGDTLSEDLLKVD